MILLRHGATVWSTEARTAGWTDIPLDPARLPEIDAVAETLRRQSIDRIITSDLARARETGARIATRLGLPVLTDARLREFHYGAWEGLTHTQIEERCPEELNGYLDHPESFRLTSGEALADLFERVGHFLDEQKPTSEHLLLVSHAMTLRILLLRLRGLPLKELWKTEGLRPLEWINEQV